MPLLEVWSEMLQNEPSEYGWGQRRTVRGTFPSFSGVCVNTGEIMIGLAGWLSPESDTLRTRVSFLTFKQDVRKFPDMFLEIKSKSPR